jgi:hypothetical protein
MQASLAVGSAGVNVDSGLRKPQSVSLRPSSLARSDAWQGDRHVTKFHNGKPLDTSD